LYFLNVNLGINSSTKLQFYPICGQNEFLKFYHFYRIEGNAFAFNILKALNLQHIFSINGELIFVGCSKFKCVH